MPEFLQRWVPIGAVAAAALACGDDVQNGSGGSGSGGSDSTYASGAGGSHGTSAGGGSGGSGGGALDHGGGLAQSAGGGDSSFPAWVESCRLECVALNDGGCQGVLPRELCAAFCQTFAAFPPACALPRKAYWDCMLTAPDICDPAACQPEQDAVDAACR
jgi:hypothetical protein